MLMAIPGITYVTIKNTTLYLNDIKKIRESQKFSEQCVNKCLILCQKAIQFICMNNRENNRKRSAEMHPGMRKDELITFAARWFYGETNFCLFFLGFR